MAKKKKSAGVIVIYDDGDCINIPMTWDTDCDGAIMCGGEGSTVAWFPDVKAARKAIKISRQFALLNEAQAKPANTDFTDSIKLVKIFPLESK